MVNYLYIEHYKRIDFSPYLVFLFLTHYSHKYTL